MNSITVEEQKLDKPIDVEEVIDVIHTFFPTKDPNGRMVPDSKLTSTEFRFSGGDLYRMLLVLEERFVVYCDPSDISQIGFNSPSDIASLLNTCRTASRKNALLETQERDEHYERCH